jgi:glucosamine kinase
MILVGISGSSKCDWQLIENEKTIGHFSTGGLNPIFHSEEEIYQIMMSTPELKDKQIDVAYVYSAGCGSKTFQNVIKRAFSRAFPKSHHYINHDIVASALATYEGVPSISCILGTGSNSCYFDGDIVRQETPALDYVLGDEGGGSNYGKQLLNAYLYKTLPADLSKDFSDQYRLTKDEILENVYMKAYPNVYLASFMKFIQAHKEHDYFRAMITKGMNDFMDLYVITLSKYTSVKTHFTGSIAFYFDDILKEVAAKKGIEVGKIIKEPINDLVQYHFMKRYNKS